MLEWLDSVAFLVVCLHAELYLTRGHNVLSARVSLAELAVDYGRCPKEERCLLGSHEFEHHDKAN